MSMKSEYQVYADDEYFYFSKVDFSHKNQSQSRILRSRKFKKEEVLRIIRLYDEAQSFDEFRELIVDERTKRREEWENSRRNLPSN